MLAAGLRLWSLWPINPRPQGWELVGQLGGFALAAAFLWTLLRFGWIFSRARIREDREELRELRPLREEVAALRDTDPKLKILLKCAGLGKELLKKEVRNSDHLQAWLSMTRIFDAYLESDVYPSLNEVEQNRIRYVKWSRPPRAEVFYPEHANKSAQIEAMVNVIDGIIEEVHKDAKNRRQLAP